MISNGNIDTIIPKGTIIPLRGKKIVYSKSYVVKSSKSNIQYIKVYEGYRELGQFEIKLSQDNKEKNIIISMSINENSKLNITAKVNNEKNKEINLKMIQNEEIIGIDFGTSFSCVAIKKNDNVEVIRDYTSNLRIIPSIICYTDKKWLVGLLAKNNMIKFPDSTISEGKKLIGKKTICPKDIYIEKIENDKIYYEIKKDKKLEKIYTSDFSSIIFNHIYKIIKENNDNKEIKKAIIALPKHFNELQINEIKKSAEKEGFEIIKIIPESYAAAIGYADTIKTEKEKKVLIFDLGSAYLNITIAKIKQIQCQEIISTSYEYLGGEYFTERLMDYIIEEIKKKDEFKNIDFNKKNDIKTMRALMKIKLECENVKMRLSNDKDVIYMIEELTGDDDFKFNIKSDKLEELCIDLWKECLNKVDETIKKSKLKKEEIDEIILVGGSTRIPKIQEMLNDYFKKKPLQNVNADEIVAQGAAIA